MMFYWETQAQGHPVKDSALQPWSQQDKETQQDALVVWTCLRGKSEIFRRSPLGAERDIELLFPVRSPLQGMNSLVLLGHAGNHRGYPHTEVWNFIMSHDLEHPHFHGCLSTLAPAAVDKIAAKLEASPCPRSEDMTHCRQWVPGCLQWESI